MANSKFAYVKQLEEERRVLPCCYFVVRIDGGNFKAFTKTHGYTKPNDIRGLHLMNACAKEVMEKFDEIDLAYGHSDEILSFSLENFFPEQELLYVPSFDGRIVLLPTEREAKDYFRWRQVDCHINTQYNECFWNLINKDGYSHQQAYNTLITTQKKEKNELLFSKFGINYNDLPEIFRRGSILMRTEQILKGGHVAEQVDITQMESDKVAPPEEIPSDATIPCQRDALEKFTLSHENLVSDIFWEKYHFLFAK